MAKANLRKQIKDILIYVGTNAFMQLAGLAAVPFFWRQLTPTDYGIIGITDIISGFLAATIGLSLEQSINKNYYTWKEDERKSGLGTIWLLNWASIAILGSLALILLSKTSQILFPKALFYPYIFMGTLTSIATCFGQIAFTTIRIKGLPVLYSFFTLLFFGSQIGLRIYLVLFLHKGLIGYYQGGLIAGIVYMLCSLIIMATFSKFEFSFKNVKSYLRFSLPIVPQSMLNVISNIMDRFLLQRFATLETMGIYSLSLRFAGIITNLHDALKLSYGPFLWKSIAKGNEGKEEITKTTPLYLAPLFVTALILSLFTENILVLINQLHYLPIAQYVPLLSGVMLLGCLYLYYSPGIILSGKTKYLWIPSAFQLLAIVVFSLFLIPKFQIAGVIASKYAAAIGFFGIAAFISHRVFRLNHEWRKGFILGVLFIAFTGLASVIPSSFPSIKLTVKITFALSYMSISAWTVFGKSTAWGKMRQQFFGKKSVS